MALPRPGPAAPGYAKGSNAAVEATASGHFVMGPQNRARCFQEFALPIYRF